MMLVGVAGIGNGIWYSLKYSLSPKLAELCLIVALT